jgi:hypothetical protein
VTLDTVMRTTHSSYQLTVNSQRQRGSDAHRPPETTMTERHAALHDPPLEDVAVWHPLEGAPTEEVTIGCPVDATIGTRSSTGSRRPEGD